MAPRESKNQPGSWEVDADKPKPTGETRARRSFCVSDLVTQPLPGINTTYDIVKHAAKTFGKKEAFGTRPVLDVITEVKDVKKTVGGKETVEKKEWKYFKLGAYQWITYEQFLARVGRVGTGLYELGLGRREGQEDQFFNIYSMTCFNWQLMAQACGSISTPFCTAYDTLGPSGLAHAINEPSVVGLFTNADLLPTLLKILDQTPTLKTIIYDGTPKPELLEQIRAREGMRILSLEELEELGAKTGKVIDVPPKREDIACVMYTSGSTGAPKGVTLTHGNLVASVGAVHRLLGEILSSNDLYLAFLPLAHILEIIVEISWLFVGMPIGYGRIKTLTDASVRECKGDIAELRPTIMCGVPAVWELIRKGVTSKLAAAGIVTQSVFKAAYKAKLAATNNGIPGIASIADAVVFNKVKAQTGGRLRYVLNGGAKLSDASQEFLSNSLVTILNGYGLTETVGMTAIMHPSFYSVGPAGTLVPSMEVKLVDIPDAGYLSTNKFPQGEVYCRGASLFAGYFKRPDLDAEAITSDGWFKTGDVGQWNPDGTLSIIDRMKNLVKLSGGEYIALEKLESVYRSSPLVGNLCLYADANARQPIAIVVAHEVNVLRFVKDRSLTSSKEIHDVCADPKVRAAALTEINAVGKKAGLANMELLQAVVLVADEWTPESGLVTAAQKLQRKPIEKKFVDDIKKAYA